MKSVYVEHYAEFHTNMYISSSHNTVQSQFDDPLNQCSVLSVQNSINWESHIVRCTFYVSALFHCHSTITSPAGCQSFPGSDCCKLVSACVNICDSNEDMATVLMCADWACSSSVKCIQGHGSLNRAVTLVIILWHYGEYFGTSDEPTLFWSTDVTLTYIDYSSEHFQALHSELCTLFHSVFNITIKGATRIPFSRMLICGPFFLLATGMVP
jgi:hypothetical protein